MSSESNRPSTPTSNSSSKPNLALKIVSLLFAVAIGIGVVSFRLPPWAQDMASDWGPGFVILGMLAAGMVHYLPRNMVSDFVDAQKQQAVAIFSISVSLQQMSGQGGKLDEIKEILSEIQMDQRVSAERLRRIEERHV